MSKPNPASHEYLRSAVLTATPEQLQLMLYDGAVRFATRGLEALRARDREAAFEALDRAQQIVLELDNGIRREVNPTVADQMRALYHFVYRRLIDANIHQDVVALEEALRILRHMRETWILLLEKLQQERRGPAPVGPDTSNPSSPPAPFVAEA